MKRIVSVLCLLALMLGLVLGGAVCASAAEAGGATLVVYFSCTGNTKAIAAAAADILGADTYEIVPAEPYTDADLAYYTGGRADREQADPSARPAISGGVEDMGRYDTVLLGYPIWHGQAPRIISTFLESYDFSGKTILPFCTSGSSPIGSSDDDLHPLAPGADWLDGTRFAAGTDRAAIAAWLEDNGITAAKPAATPSPTPTPTAKPTPAPTPTRAPTATPAPAQKTGWAKEGGRTYYYENGVKQKGLRAIGGKSYYFSVKDGAMLTGLVNIGKGQLCYFSVKDGHQLRGLVTTRNDGTKNYFSVKTGVRLTGLVTTDNRGTQRYFSVKDGHMLKGGWARGSGSMWYYLDRTGVVIDRIRSAAKPGYTPGASPKPSPNPTPAPAAQTGVFNFDRRTVMLNSGYEMPIMGLGTYSLTDQECYNSVTVLLEAGGRLIDTAYMYGNEAAVGRAIRDSDVPREEIFVITKIYPGAQYADPEKAIQDALDKLDIGYIDMMLLHHPGTNDVKAYKAMEKAVAEGKIRSLGLSNWYVKELEEFLPQVDITPALVQNEIHPYYQENDVIPYIQGLGIVVQGWYPFGGRGYTADLLGNGTISAIAAAHGVSSAQVILRWDLQKGVVVIPGSSNPDHIRENLDLFGFELTPDEMARINALDRGEKHDWY